MMQVVLWGLCLWQGINDALMVAAVSVVGANEAAQMKGGAFLPMAWAMGLCAFVAFAKSLEKSISSWVVALRAKTRDEGLETRDLKTTGPVMPITGIALLAVGALCLSGCVHPVPANVITITGPSGKYHVETPKNVAIDGFNAEVHTNGVFTLRFNKWTSTNDPQVISKAFAGQVALQNSINQGLKDAIGIAVEKAIEGAKTAQNAPPEKVARTVRMRKAGRTAQGQLAGAELKIGN